LPFLQNSDIFARKTLFQMRKHILLFAGSAILFASCGSNNNNQANEQAKIDSIANAKVAEHDAAAAAQQDSVMKAAEAEKAKATEAEAKAKEAESKAHASTKKGSTKTTTTTATPPPPPTNPKETRFSTPAANGNAPVSPEATKKKEDRFK
jgi:predicted  nucleic acid-binding Zn-ribbon protein